jgi:hypothetical protein
MKKIMLVALASALAAPTAFAALGDVVARAGEIPPVPGERAGRGRYVGLLQRLAQ